MTRIGSRPMGLPQTGNTAGGLEVVGKATQLGSWLSPLDSTQEPATETVNPPTTMRKSEKKVPLSWSSLVKQGDTPRSSPTSEPPCWRWKESQSADWVGRWGHGARTPSGKARPRGSLLWGGFAGVLGGSSSWTRARGWPLVQRNGVLFLKSN